MRTTVSISDELLAAAKRRAHERGQTLGQLVDAALQRELNAAPTATPAPQVPVFHGGTGPRPGVDLSSNRALLELLDEADASGDLVTGAAIAMEHGCEVVTLDRDFARFESVRHRRPTIA